MHKLQVFDSRAFALGGAHSVRFVPVPTAERAHRPSRPGRGAIRGHAAANGEGPHICVCLAMSASAFWTTCTLAWSNLVWHWDIAEMIQSWLAGNGRHAMPMDTRDFPIQDPATQFTQNFTQQAALSSCASG